MNTFDESKVRRQPEGVTGGGQFATKPKSESTVSLAPVKPLNPATAYGGHFLTPAGQAELALALHERTGWELVEARSETSVRTGVRTPNGRILSVAGVDSEFTWSRRSWRDSGAPAAPEPADEGTVRERAGVPAGDATPDRAHDVANRLLAQHEGVLTDPDTPIDETDEETYANGMCYELARELNEQTGWPIVVVSDAPGGPIGWVHAGVRRPDGKIVDVRGVHEEGSWVDEHGALVDSYGEDEEDYDGDDVWVYPIEDITPLDRLPENPYEGIAPSDVERTRKVARMLAEQHS